MFGHILVSTSSLHMLISQVDEVYTQVLVHDHEHQALCDLQIPLSLSFFLPFFLCTGISSFLNPSIISHPALLSWLHPLILSPYSSNKLQTSTNTYTYDIPKGINYTCRDGRAREEKRKEFFGHGKC